MEFVLEEKLLDFYNIVWARWEIILFGCMLGSSLDLTRL